MPAPTSRWGLPGWLTCLVGTAAVLGCALWEASRGSIGPTSGIVLVVTTVLVGAVTRRGDLPLVLMYPPLAYVFSVLIAGQLLVDHGAHWKSQQGLMLYDTLGRNARWVFIATITAVVMVLLRILVDRIRRR